MGVVVVAIHVKEVADQYPQHPVVEGEVLHPHLITIKGEEEVRRQRRPRWEGADPRLHIQYRRGGLVTAMGKVGGIIIVIEVGAPRAVVAWGQGEGEGRVRVVERHLVVVIVTGKFIKEVPNQDISKRVFLKSIFSIVF